MTVVGNAAEYDQVQATVDATAKEFGRLDMVVANPGFVTHDTVAVGDPAGWPEMVLTNVLGPAWDSYGSLPPDHPLTADRLAESIVWAIRQPAGVDIKQRDRTADRSVQLT